MRQNTLIQNWRKKGKGTKGLRGSNKYCRYAKKIQK